MSNKMNNNYSVKFKKLYSSDRKAWRIHWRKGRSKATSVYKEARTQFDSLEEKTAYIEAERDHPKIIPLPVRARMGSTQKTTSSKELMS